MKTSQDIFKQVKDIEIEPSVYMKPRILARLNEISPSRFSLFFWKMLGLSSSAVALGLALFVTISHYLPSENPAFKALTHELLAVKIDVYQAESVARMDIILPDGVQFYSEKFPQLNELSQLSLAVNEQMSLKGLPIVVKGQTEGVKRLTIHFYNAKHELIQTKTITIDFSKRATT